MEKLKAFIYPKAFSPIQDTLVMQGTPDAGLHWKNTVPFGRHGITQWVEQMPEAESDYYLCGQVQDFQDRPFDLSVFWHIKECPEKHIVDLEGDARPGLWRDEFAGCIRIACGAPFSWRGQRVFPRPTTSRLFLHLLKSADKTWPAATSKMFGFIGQFDKLGVRQKMRDALNLAQVPRTIQFLDKWHGVTPVGDVAHQAFVMLLLNTGIALCPQGEGVATARFNEACYFGRFPVCIGESMLLGEDKFDMSFAIQLSADLSVKELAEQFSQIGSMSLEEIQERGRRSRKYFNEVVAPYFRDPTRAFLEWVQT